ncbi:MAG: STT3 domain-containing protein, partial [Candidatus Omnitrophica bacterium]|nr:STT3 domain-containing protein [Candidatus Omnitrophota bacterium]
MQNKPIFYLVAGLIVLAIGTYFRYIPVSHLADYRLNGLARQFVLEKLGAEVERQVNLAYPGKTAAERAMITKQRFLEVLKKNRREIKSTERKNAAMLRASMPPELKTVHLIEADAYYYLGLTKNLIDTGAVSPKIKNGLYYNPLMMAPYGNYYFFDLHPYIGLMVYKLVSLFDRSMPLEQGVGYTSLFLAALACCIFLLFCYGEKMHPFPAFVSLLSFAAAPMFFQRSLYGWYDTDPYNVIFPLLIIFCLLAVLNRTGPSKQKIIFLAAAALVTGLYPMFWSGWIYAPISGLIFFVSIILYSGIRRDIPSAKEYGAYLGVYCAITVITAVIFRGSGGLIFSLKDTFERMAVFKMSDFPLWPDSYIMVSELKKISLAKMAVLAGGRVLSAVALTGLAVMLMKPHILGRDRAIVPKGLLVASFFVIPCAMAMSAERFAILLVVPTTVLFAMTVNSLYIRATTGPSIILKALTQAGLSAFILIPLSAMFIMDTQTPPVIYNETWDKIMSYLRDKTPSSSIVNTWWSPGHFITGMGRRRVLYDGATLEKPVGYWISRVFMAQSEREALGILRMIDSSGNKAVDFLTNRNFSLSKAIETINTVISLPTDKRGAALQPLLNADDAVKFLVLIDGAPDPAYLFLYTDLAEQTAGSEFMAYWDFKRADEFKNLKTTNPGYAKKILKEKAGNNYVRILWGISGGGPLYAEKASPEV